MSESRTIGNEETRRLLGRWNKPRGSSKALYDAVGRGTAPGPVLRRADAPLNSPTMWCPDEVMEWCQRQAPAGLRPWVGVEYVEVGVELTYAMKNLERAMDDPEMPEGNAAHGSDAIRSLERIRALLERQEPPEPGTAVEDWRKAGEP